MPKLKCDNPKCPLYNKELDIVEAIVTADAPYSEKQEVYDVPPFFPNDYALRCPQCETILEEP